MLNIFTTNQNNLSSLIIIGGIAVIILSIIAYFVWAYFEKWWPFK